MQHNRAMCGLFLMAAVFHCVTGVIGNRSKRQSQFQVSKCCLFGTPLDASGATRAGDCPYKWAIKMTTPLVSRGSCFMEPGMGDSNIRGLSIWSVGLVRFPAWECRLYQMKRSCVPFLKTLDLSNNEIGAVGWNDLSGYLQLEELVLRNNKLEWLPREVLSKNTQLRWLDLSGNRINNINPQQFRSNIYLQWVDLSSNKIYKLSKDTFRNNRNLTYVNLGNNALRAIDPAVFEPSTATLETVSLSNNILSSFNMRFLDLVKVNEVDLSGNIITQFERSGWRLPGKLVNTTRALPSKIINLAYNQLTTPAITSVESFLQGIESYGLLSALYTFRHVYWYLNGNRLMCDCNMAIIVAVLRRYVQLRRSLDVLVNSLKELECSRPIPMSKMPIRMVREREFACPTYEQCPVGCSCIKKYIYEPLPAIGALPDRPVSQVFDYRLFVMEVYAYCNGTGITRLPWYLPEVDIIEGQRRRVYLYLQDNFIGSLDNRTYLRDVVTLNMTNNSLVYVKPAVFREMQGQLKFAMLDNNRLTGIPAEAIPQSGALEALSLANNPLSCDCYLASMLRALGGRLANDTRLVCMGPWMTGENPINASLEEMEKYCPAMRAEARTMADGAATAIGVTLVLVIVAILICAVVVGLKIKMIPPRKHSTKWDVYMSFSAADKSTIRWMIETLAPMLEHRHKPPLRLCIQNRDFQIYDPAHTEELLGSVLEQTQATMFLLSPSFAKDEKYRMELRRSQELDRQIIFILLSDIDVDFPQELLDAMSEYAVLRPSDPWFAEKLWYELDQPRFFGACRKSRKVTINSSAMQQQQREMGQFQQTPDVASSAQ